MSNLFHFGFTACLAVPVDDQQRASQVVCRALHQYRVENIVIKGVWLEHTHSISILSSKSSTNTYTPTQNVFLSAFKTFSSNVNGCVFLSGTFYLYVCIIKIFVLGWGYQYKINWELNFIEKRMLTASNFFHTL